jgi:YVTN family beta-propeller protein
MGSALSPDGRELYVSTGRGNHVAVVDTLNRDIVASIPVGSRPWGIARSPDGSRVFTANGASNDVSVIDARNRTELNRIKVGDGPWGLAVGR